MVLAILLIAYLSFLQLGKYLNGMATILANPYVSISDKLDLVIGIVVLLFTLALAFYFLIAILLF